MSFYQLAASEHLKCHLNTTRLVACEVVMAEENGRFLLLLFDDGRFQVLEEGKWQTRGSVTMFFDERKVSHILKARTCKDTMIVQTFKSIFMVDISAVIDLALSSNNANFTPKMINLVQQRQGWLCKMTNIHFKLINRADKLFLKISGRQKQQIVYSFCELNTATATLTLIQQYKHAFPNEYKVSLQSQDKDIIIYQSNINKFKPIKISLLSYFSHQSSHDTSLLQHHEIMQFQEHCYVTNIFKLSKDMLCVVTGSHLEDDCQSNVIIFDCRIKQTINNIAIKDVMVISADIFCRKNARLEVNSTDISLDCFARKGSKHYAVQVFPFCFFPHRPKEIPTSDAHFSCPNTLILHNSSTGQLSLLPKISKQAIYLSWLLTLSPPYSSLFRSVLALLD